MFEEEAEEYLGNFADCANCKERWSICADSLDEYCLVNGCCCAIPKEQDIYIAGAKLGYNKANEWHYVKDGDLPKDNRYILIATRTDVYRGFYENNNWYGDEGGRLRCIAWKELPELPKEIE